MALVLQLTVPSGEVELASGRLWALGSSGIEERNGSGPGEVVLIAAFPTAAATEEVAAEVGAEVVSIDDESWRDTWRRHAEPVDVGAGLRIVPAWHGAPPGGTRVDLLVDPGPCFGSGTHPTTRTLLAALETLIAPGATVLDVGTGSGILAIAAARLGAAAVEAIDIDPDAVPVTLANAAANDVTELVRASTTDLADVSGPFDVVLANLSAATLTDLASDLVRVAGRGGTLVLSGMLDGQWRHVQPSFATLTVERQIDAEGWTSIVLRLPGSD